MPLRTVRDLERDETITLRCDGCGIARIWTREELRLAVGADQDLHHLGQQPRLTCAKCGQVASSAWFSWQAHG